MSSGASAVAISLRIISPWVSALFWVAKVVTGDGRVGEAAHDRARAAEDVEPKLAVVGTHACAAPDDLLEFYHRTDETHEPAASASGPVEAGGEPS